jgi:hypothetical protein
MKSDKINLILLTILIIFGLTGSIMMASSNLNSTDPDELFKPELFYVGLVCTCIASTVIIIFMVRTGIDLSKPTITRVRKTNTYQINKGINLW